MELIEKRLHYFFPWIIAAAYLLPGMHQSSLGALMLLAGERVHPLWQTPWLPVLYLGAATFMSFGCVAGTTMLCCLVWKRAMDMEVLDEAARITSWLIFGWLGLRLLDIVFRGAVGTAFHFDRFAGVFWLEVSLIAAGGWLLRRSLQQHAPAADVHGLHPQFGGRHDLPLQPNHAGLPAQSAGAVFSGDRRSTGFARIHLSGHRGFPDCGETAGNSSRSVERVARHGELLPVPASLHPVDRLFQVRTFRRKRRPRRKSGD